MCQYIDSELTLETCYSRCVLLCAPSFRPILFSYIAIFWPNSKVRLDKNRMDDYRSWTKVDCTNPGLDENSVGQNVVGRKAFGPK